MGLLFPPSGPGEWQDWSHQEKHRVPLLIQKHTVRTEARRRRRKFVLCCRSMSGGKQGSLRWMWTSITFYCVLKETKLADDFASSLIVFLFFFFDQPYWYLSLTILLDDIWYLIFSQPCWRAIVSAYMFPISIFMTYVFTDHSEEKDEGASFFPYVIFFVCLFVFYPLLSILASSNYWSCSKKNRLYIYMKLLCSVIFDHICVILSTKWDPS